MRHSLLRILLLGALTLGMLPAFGCAKTYRIVYDNCKPGFVDAPEAARQGETVTLKKGIVFDEIQDVILDGTTLQPQGEADGFLIYTFMMPDHDVTVAIESHNISGIE